MTDPDIDALALRCMPRRAALRRGLFAGVALAGVALGLVLVLHAPITRLRLPLADAVQAPRPFIWGHRGNGGRGAPENTPEAVEIAARERFDGVELDVFYLPDGAGLVVAHDDPRVEGAVRGIPIDRFAFPPAMRLWIDAKNLGELSDADLHAFANALKEHGLLERSFVEGMDMRALQRLSKDGVQTIHWLAGWRLELLPVLKFYYAVSGIDGVSVDYRFAHKVTPHFDGRGVFLFTVNALGDIARLCAVDAVAVILTDLPNAHADCAEQARRAVARLR
ncbi:glycerophosphodiester phosphodiesterase [Stappia stellulata]|uniref:glycerophosphodiester phosphodiesterase n=1 Tax=Stappia stellulata TaxID=71235 RepID=UPI000400BA4D|nr:glycerophosphodiester phosphodiesterase [Stappia stellulata]